MAISLRELVKHNSKKWRSRQELEQELERLRLKRKQQRTSYKQLLRAHEALLHRHNRLLDTHLTKIVDRELDALFQSLSAEAQDG